MSRYNDDAEMMMMYQKPSGCANFLHYTWKTITCLLSHITLVSMVVAYCAVGAIVFEYLEVAHERMVKQNVTYIRNNITEKMWQITLDLEVLEFENFTKKALVHLMEFEDALLVAMNKDGWDGEEDPKKVQWTQTGALFYSIIVITTIGYGHISPKTFWGKIVTIFYAILGIPLMLLCLSNIGDIMATSFRFLYWKVCCYMCTKRPKKRRPKSRGTSYSRAGSYYSRTEDRFSRSRNTSFRRSVRTSTRSADSGFALSEVSPYSHSDTDLRIHDDSCTAAPQNRLKRGSSLPRLRQSQMSRFSDSTVPLRKPPQTFSNRPQYNLAAGGGSLDRKKFPKGMLVELDPEILARTKILCNKYVVGGNEALSNMAPGITMRELEGQGRTSPISARRAKSLPRNQNFLEPPGMMLDDRDEVESTRSHQTKKKKPAQASSPRMMTPLGYAHKSKYLDDPDSDDEYYYDEDYPYEKTRVRIRPVPIWLCVFLVVSYIVAGAFLFQSWENWGFLDAAYFCFITLTTIGFGDLVPAKNVNQDSYRATVSIALCSLYLLFGISLLAMSFNLVQEEVISNVKSVAKRLGIIKADVDDDEDSEGDV